MNDLVSEHGHNRRRESNSQNARPPRHNGAGCVDQLRGNDGIDCRLSNTRDNIQQRGYTPGQQPVLGIPQRTSAARLDAVVTKGEEREHHLAQPKLWTSVEKKHTDTTPRKATRTMTRAASTHPSPKMGTPMASTVKVDTVMVADNHFTPSPAS